MHATGTRLKDPVIVMGMAQCGTTLLAEMVHRGGTPMYAGDTDPSYDDGIKYERRLCQAINRQILGVPRDGKNPYSIEPMWTWNLQPFPKHELQALQEEVGEGAWGFKDPRTTHTYQTWLTTFPRGPRLYSYRGHREYLRRSLRATNLFSLKEARQRMRAWIAYNEAIVMHCSLDRAAGRPWALIRYDELMDSPVLIDKMRAVTGIPLSDARHPDLHRVRASAEEQVLPLRERFYVASAEAGFQGRLRNVYTALEALRLRA